jgi:hypothetical protein
MTESEGFEKLDQGRDKNHPESSITAALYKLVMSEKLHALSLAKSTHSCSSMGIEPNQNSILLL